MRLSLIIPTLNEAENLAVLLPYLRQKADRRLLEIIVVDAGSSDDTLTVATDHGADVAFKAKHPGRGPQMNEAAQRASGNTLYFVHADSRPPVDFLDDIEHALEKGYQVGGYRFRFDSDKVLLKINAWFTRFPALACRG
ncbi:MAG: glycosyltransferase, partial [Bacteroidota bacterium]